MSPILSPPAESEAGAESGRNSPRSPELQGIPALESVMAHPRVPGNSRIPRRLSRGVLPQKEPSGFQKPRPWGSEPRMAEAVAMTSIICSAIVRLTLPVGMFWGPKR